jgi:hypothetical protein
MSRSDRPTKGVVARRAGAGPGRLAVAATILIASGLVGGAAAQVPAPPARPGAVAAPAAPAAPAVPGATADRPPDDALRAVETEGRRIVAYHEAIAKARERARAHDAKMADDARVVVVDRSGVWHVVFIKRDPAGGESKALMAAVDAVFQPKVGELSAFQVFEPYKPAPTDAQAVLRALESARTAAMAKPGLARPPYDESIFRDKDGFFTVVMHSKPDIPGTVKFGGDLIARVSGDGNQVVEMRPMHDTTVAVTVPARSGGAPSLHSHTTGDLPTSTDVAQVIEKPTLAPHIVLTPRWMFRIAADGTLTWLGPNAVPPVATGGGH